MLLINRDRSFQVVPRPIKEPILLTNDPPVCSVWPRVKRYDRWAEEYDDELTDMCDFLLDALRNLPLCSNMKLNISNVTEMLEEVKKQIHRTSSNRHRCYVTA